MTLLPAQAARVTDALKVGISENTMDKIIIKGLRIFLSVSPKKRKTARYSSLMSDAWDLTTVCNTDLLSATSIMQKL